MHRRHRRAGTACAVLAAALVALSGCGSGADGHHAAGAEAASPKAAPAADGAVGAAERPEPKRTPTASHRPALPNPRLTPATGSFTKREKKYLSGRVPEGTDPAAVLQLGQEACQRVRRTAAHDRDAAVGAVITGDIPGARNAIPELCPDQLSVLHTAESGLPDGTRKRPAAGTYRALVPSTSCSWRALGASGKTLASGAVPRPVPDDGSGAGPAPVKKITARVPDGTRTFVSSGCYAWVPA